MVHGTMVHGTMTARDADEVCEGAVQDSTRGYLRTHGTELT